MRYRKLDKDNDFATGHGIADFYADLPEAVAQAVLTRLRLWAGEWFEDVEEGTPYRQKVLGKYNLRRAAPAIKRRMLQTPGVSSISEFTASYDGEARTLAVSATIHTVYGAAVIEEVL